MALPQSIDPITLNISGKPAISTVAPTQITSAGGVGMPDPTVENVNRPVNPLLGALFGGLLGYATGQNLGLGGSGLTPINRPQTGTGSGGGSGGGGGGGGGGTTSGGLPPVSGGSGTGSGNIGGMTGATSAIQTDASGNFVNTKTGEPVTPMGNNLFKDSPRGVATLKKIITSYCVDRSFESPITISIKSKRVGVLAPNPECGISHFWKAKFEKLTLD